MKIKDVHDAHKVGDLCIGKLVGEKSLVYFNIIVLQEDVSSNCYFSPVSEVRKPKENVVKYAHFVEDVEKIIKLLLSHPKVSDVEYHEKENMISATFMDDAEIIKEEF